MTIAGRVLLLLLGVGACDVGATEPALDGCATPRADDWSGVTSIRNLGSGGYDQVGAAVTWTRASTTACVDVYQPSGTATYAQSGPCVWSIDPASAAIVPTDGVLRIDRTTAPATYLMQGTTRWPSVIHCSDDPAEGPNPIGGLWTDVTGAIDGQVIAGDQTIANRHLLWQMGTGSGVSTP